MKPTNSINTAWQAAIANLPKREKAEPRSIKSEKPRHLSWQDAVANLPKPRRIGDAQSTESSTLRAPSRYEVARTSNIGDPGFDMVPVVAQSDLDPNFGLLPPPPAELSIPV